MPDTTKCNCENGWQQGPTARLMGWSAKQDPEPCIKCGGTGKLRTAIMTRGETVNLDSGIEIGMWVALGFAAFGCIGIVLCITQGW